MTSHSFDEKYEPKKPRVLVVEDEAMVAMQTEDMLVDLGFEVAAIASSLEEALKRSSVADFDVAVLDVNLRGEKVFPVAEALLALQIPFVFTTGYGVGGVREDLRHAPVIVKPFSAPELQQKLKEVMDRRSS
ncbi:response regulator [Rhizobium indicum]|uniref:response regulator n=1 Tax=Rhizobium indicum TaxID=2583231 RepID=UPI001FEDCB10|nr:response regulator [Rhizobium indicum]